MKKSNLTNVASVLIVLAGALASGGNVWANGLFYQPYSTDTAHFGDVPLGEAGTYLAYGCAYEIDDNSLYGYKIEITDQSGPGTFSVAPTGYQMLAPHPEHEGACNWVTLENAYEFIITFTPTGIGETTAVIDWWIKWYFNGVEQQVSAFNFHEPVYLVANGVEAEPPPEERVEEIRIYFGDSINDGTVIGTGRGNSATNRLGAIDNMMLTVSDHLRNGEIELACIQLEDIYEKIDGLGPPSSPPDFAVGESAAGVAAMVYQLMLDLGCV